MSKLRTTKLWTRTTKALGKFVAGMVSLPDRHLYQTARDDVYPRFPMF